MMMGTADEIVKAPEKGPVFMEDLPEEEQVVVVVMSFYNKSQTCLSLYFSTPCYFAEITHFFIYLLVVMMLQKHLLITKFC